MDKKNTGEKMQDDVKRLEENIERRNKKIEDVQGKIDRQNNHIKKIAESRDRQFEHINRWEKQNKRDRALLEKARYSAAVEKHKDEPLHGAVKDEETPQDAPQSDISKDPVEELLTETKTNN